MNDSSRMESGELSQGAKMALAYLFSEAAGGLTVDEARRELLQRFPVSVSDELSTFFKNKQSGSDLCRGVNLPQS